MASEWATWKFGDVLSGDVHGSRGWVKAMFVGWAGAGTSLRRRVVPVVTYLTGTSMVETTEWAADMSFWTRLDEPTEAHP